MSTADEDRAELAQIMQAFKDRDMDGGGTIATLERFCELLIAEKASAEMGRLREDAGDNWATIIGIQSLCENWATGMSSAQECMAEIHTMLLDAARWGAP